MTELTSETTKTVTDVDYTTSNKIGNETENLDLGTKKRRPRKEVQEIFEEKSTNLDIGIGSQNLIDANREWPDYTYEEALGIVFRIIRENNPAFETEKKKLVIKPPIAERARYYKTSFSNFLEVCRCLKRDYSHVSQFILSELGTTGSIDKDNCLIVTGKFRSIHFENVIREYIKEFILCHTCKSPETELKRETRLLYLQCHNCGSKSSVTIMKKWFKAVVGRQSATRLATVNVIK